ncbi:MAG: hypothetical protein QOE23_288 [Pseudonocardiales bacterium]|jgi:uncharacterized membrane protein YphA (DoxX/SURF4 family)|nr:hypothetical protein [Pseudonocardiales bacterium]
MRYLELTCRVLLGVVFAVSVTGKLRDAAAFTDATRRLLPMRWASRDRVIANSVGAVEFIVVALLAYPGTSRLGFALAAILLIAFSVAIRAALRRGVHAPCRCFGASDTPLGRRHLVRNGLLLVIALLGALTPSGPLTPSGACLAVGTGLVLATLVVRLDLVVELFLPHPSLRS